MQSRGYEETELEFDTDLVTGSDIQHFRRQVNALIIKPAKFHNLSMKSKKLFYRYKHVL